MCNQGQFGPIKLGDSRDDVLRAFGKPEKWDRLKSDQVWAYGPVQFFFNWDNVRRQGFLWLIVLYYWDEDAPFRVPTSMQPAGWLPGYETTIYDIQEFAHQHGLLFEVDPTFPPTDEDDERSYKLGQHGRVNFTLTDHEWYVRKVCIL